MKIRLAAVSLVLWALTPSLWAIDADAPLPDAGQQALYEKLTNEVRCLVCQNQTLADSSAPLAADLRREIRDQVAQGGSEAEIKTFLTERYGDFVLYRPRFAGPSTLLWLAPVLLIGIGALTLWRILRRRTLLPVTTDSEDAADDASAWE